MCVSYIPCVSVSLLSVAFSESLKRHAGQCPGHLISLLLHVLCVAAWHVPYAAFLSPLPLAAAHFVVGTDVLCTAHATPPPPAFSHLHARLAFACCTLPLPLPPFCLPCHTTLPPPPSPLLVGWVPHPSPTIDNLPIPLLYAFYLPFILRSHTFYPFTVGWFGGSGLCGFSWIVCVCDSGVSFIDVYSSVI